MTFFKSELGLGDYTETELEDLAAGFIALIENLNGIGFLGVMAAKEAMSPEAIEAVTFAIDVFHKVNVRRESK